MNPGRQALRPQSLYCPRDRSSDQNTQASSCAATNKPVSRCLRSADVTEYELIKEMILEKSSKYTYTHIHARTHARTHKELRFPLMPVFKSVLKYYIAAT